jgi:branched-chain amino acid transport system ATP-binding protein
MLELKQINVFYDDMQALWDVSLKAEEGEITAIIGSNGAGKTTILKSISNLTRIESGIIEFEDKRIDLLPSHRIVDVGISHIPEGRGLFPLMTVLENLILGSFTKRAKKERAKTLEWVFELFPILKERKSQPAGTLSGGEQQMVAIGRGLMARPKLLMLDEPSLGLAPILVKQTFETIGRINSEGVTVLLVEQNVRQTLEIAQSAFILENGKIVLKGRGKELLNKKEVKEAYLGT